MDSFVHLHVHTHYSQLDSTCKIPELVAKAKSLGMDALAITDHGHLCGVVDFFRECTRQGIKPVLGMEAYTAPRDRKDATGPMGISAYHLLLLAETTEGLKNLQKLTSIAHQNVHQFKPRIDMEVLKEHSAGLIVTSACLGGEVASALLKQDTATATAVVERYLRVFGPERFFLEVQKHLPDQDIVNAQLLDLSQKLGVELVGTNDVHFLEREDYPAHETLCCIAMKQLLSDENRLRYSKELYLKSPAEMSQAMNEFPGARENSVRIAQRCNATVETSRRYYPAYRVPYESAAGAVEESTADAQERYLRQLCQEGLRQRFGTTDVSEDVRDRLDHELADILIVGACSYCLILWDLCRFCRENNILIGSRGAGVASFVGYLLGYCNVNPLKHGLIFERFFDPARDARFSIDFDIADDGRDLAVKYLREKYGHIAQVITFSEFVAKSACKGVGTAMGLTPDQLATILEKMPLNYPWTLDHFMAYVPDIDRQYREIPDIRRMINIARKLEGVCCNWGEHAASLVVADQPIENVVPTLRSSDGQTCTQFDRQAVEASGLLNLNLLGVVNLSTMRRTLDLEKASREERAETNLPRVPKAKLDATGRIDLDAIDMNDDNILAMFRRGETRGIFQFDAPGMKELVQQIQPDRFEDLVAANALFRPGAVEFIGTYCHAKASGESAMQIHSAIDRYLDETYGLILYQEQLMQFFHELASLSMTQAFAMMRAIQVLSEDRLADIESDFRDGALANGIGRQQARQIFWQLRHGGRFAFNKAHAVRCATIAFQNAFLKHYFPVEYMTAAPSNAWD
jgi:DNA polymerase-3 subunit alpha